MNDQPEPNFRKTLEDIRLYYHFLFKRGFRLGSVLFADHNQEAWQVTLCEGNRLIHIYNEQGIVNLVMSTIQRSREVIFFDMEAAHTSRDFFFTFDELPVSESQQLKKLAEYLEKNLVMILAQAERDNLPFIEHPMQGLTTEPKRTII